MLKVLQTFAEETKVEKIAEVGGMGILGWVLVVIFTSIILAIIGGFVGMLIAKKMFTKQLKENPPISEKAIRAMFLQMGRKPSEAQIKAVMRSMKNAK